MKLVSEAMAFLVVLVITAVSAHYEEVSPLEDEAVRELSEPQYSEVGGDSEVEVDQVNLGSEAAVDKDQTRSLEKEEETLDMLSKHGYVEGDDETFAVQDEGNGEDTQSNENPLISKRGISSGPSCLLLDRMYDDIQLLKRGLPNVLLPCEAGPFGGNGGRDFSDKAWTRYGQIVRIDLYVNLTKGELTGMRTYYGSTRYYSSLWGSTTGSRLNYMTLSSREYITKVEGTMKYYSWHNEHTYIVSALKYTTSKGRVLGWYGNAAQGIAFKAEGGQLLYMTGKYGSRMDLLNFHFDKCKVKAVA